MSKRKQEIDYAEPAAEGLSAKCQDIETKVNLMQQIKHATMKFSNCWNLLASA